MFAENDPLSGGGSDCMKPSMYCEECQVWTKDYQDNGDHTCGTEVKTSTLDSGHPDLDYEGPAMRSSKI